MSVIKKIEQCMKTMYSEDISKEYNISMTYFWGDPPVFGVLYNVDCIEGIRQLTRYGHLHDKKFDLIINDPPYYNVVKDAWDHAWESKFDYLSWCAVWLALEKDVLKDTGSLYLFGGIGEKSDTVIHLKLICDSLGLHFKDWITWAKSRGMVTRRGWVYTREEILWYVKDNKQFQWNKEHQYGTERRKRDGGKNEIRVSQNGYRAKSLYKRLTNVWSDISEQTFDVINCPIHTTPKPIKMIERIILAHTSEFASVLDPFFGSGTTGIACLRNNRHFVGFEKDPEIYAASIQRIAKEFDYAAV